MLANPGTRVKHVHLPETWRKLVVSVVAAYLYRNGKNVKAVSLNEPIDCKNKSEFVWIGLFEPFKTGA
jgi:hypothetical protein